MAWSCLALSLVALGGLGCGRIGYDPLSKHGGADAEADGIPGTDDAAMCVADPCTLMLPQCGCGATEMCQRTGPTTEQRSCIAAGIVPPDGECTGDAACTAGHLCIQHGTGTGRCHLYCDSHASCPAGIRCGFLVEGVGLGVCGSTCTLDAGCPGGSTCKVLVIYDLAMVDPETFPTCAPPAGAAAGSACVSSLDCAGSLFCDLDTEICRPMCRFDGSLPCASGTCTAAPAPIKLENVDHGFCR